jgi:hypothetical protein
MKTRVPYALALFAAMTLPAAAANTGGISGFVYDLESGKPIANATVALYGLPMRPEAPYLASSITDKKGFFVNLHLDPGRYLVTATVVGHTSSCVIDDVFSDQTATVKIYVGADGQRCVGPRVHSAIVNPNQPADEYVIPNGRPRI